MKQAIVVGKGPAGISAAIYLKRAGIDVAVIGKGLGSLERSERIENYYGLQEPVSGKELVEKGIAQAKSFDIDIISDEVVSIEKYESFIIKTADEEFEAQAVLLATGKSRAKFSIEGFEKFVGRGICFCAVCDGFFYRNKRIALIGNGDYAANELNQLRNFTKDIKIFTNGEKITTQLFPDDIEIITDKISEFYGDDKINGIIAGNNKYETDGVFVALGTASASDFARKLGVITQKDDIVVDENFMTNVDGLFAAGDATGGFLQIAKAVSDGAHASKGMIKYIKTK